jgi:DNA-binding SARP family transcriptional activator
VGSVAANFLIAAGRCAEAAEFLAWGRGRLRGAVSGHMLAVFELLDAWRAQRERDRAQRHAHLCLALRQAHDPRALVRLRWHANALGELLPIALSQGIEAHTAARVARALAIVPASDASPDWPWPVKVYTLGRFELMLHGQAPGFGRKPPRKSLALLQALIALGGRDVLEERVAAALWPDQEGDSAHRALFSALHRLRKLLGENSTVRQSGGRLSLNAERCWVDALAFERMLAAGADTAGDLLARRQAAIELYRGPFLAQEDDAAWAMPMRERLRGKFVQAVGAQAQACEARGELETALAYYRRGVEADYLVEPFYQGLMRCYAALDRRAEASSAYRTLRQTLSVVLGVAPSDASTRLYRQLRLEG